MQMEGTIKVTSERGHYQVRMNTNGNAQVYSHPATYVPYAARTINCGHYQFFATQVSTEKRIVEQLCGPDFNTEKSYFFTTLCKLITSLTNVTLATLDKLKVFFSEYVWEPSDYEKLTNAVIMKKEMKDYV